MKVRNKHFAILIVKNTIKEKEVSYFCFVFNFGFFKHNDKNINFSFSISPYSGICLSGNPYGRNRLSLCGVEEKKIIFALCKTPIHLTSVFNPDWK